MDSGGSLKTAVCSAAETVPMAVPVMMGFITAQRTMASAANAAEIPVASGAMVPLGDSVNGGSFGNSTSAEALGVWIWPNMDQATEQGQWGCG